MLRAAVEAAANRPDVREAVARVYAELQVEIDARKPRCSMSGRCCRFDEFGHRLYVTTIELAAFLPHVQPAPAVAGGCPFQIDGLCSVHTVRPFGCRVFFCDETSEAWQHAQYERFHAQIKRMHEELAVPYRYLEWREALAEFGLATGSKANPLSLPQLRL